MCVYNCVGLWDVSLARCWFLSGILVLKKFAIYLTKRKLMKDCRVMHQNVKGAC